MVARFAEYLLDMGLYVPLAVAEGFDKMDFVSHLLVKFVGNMDSTGEVAEVAELWAESWFVIVGLEHEEENLGSHQSHLEIEAVAVTAAIAEISACLGRPGQAVSDLWGIAAAVAEQEGRTGCRMIAVSGSDKGFRR